MAAHKAKSLIDSVLGKEEVQEKDVKKGLEKATHKKEAKSKDVEEQEEMNKDAEGNEIPGKMRKFQ